MSQIRENDIILKMAVKLTKQDWSTRLQHEQVGYGQKKAMRKSVGTRENLILCSKLLNDCRVSLNREL